jgi:hypothetical protein
MLRGWRVAESARWGKRQIQSGPTENRSWFQPEPSQAVLRPARAGTAQRPGPPRAAVLSWAGGASGSVTLAGYVVQPSAAGWFTCREHAYRGSPREMTIRLAGRRQNRQAEGSDLRVSRGVLIAFAAAGVAVGLAGPIAGPASAAGIPQAAVRPKPVGFSVRGGLNGAAAVSGTNAWAAGFAGRSSAPRVLLLHWNGKTWTRVTGPGVLTAPGELSAVTAVSARNAWAVGYTGTVTHQHTLLLHWNGTAWSQVTSPAPVAGALNAVTATATSGWAVGDRHPGGASFTPLILRLTRQGWSRLATTYGTHTNDDVILNGVARTRGSTAWATGTTQATSALAHWDGSTWTSAFSLFPLPAVYFFNGIAAGPGGTAFMVGARVPGGSQVPFSAKLTGTSWRKVPVHAPAGSVLKATTFAPGGHAWAAGSTGTGALIVRWPGRAWARISGPGAGRAINGLAFSAARYGWAVGTRGSGTLILHWNGSAWH